MYLNASSEERPKGLTIDNKRSTCAKGLRIYTREQAKIESIS